MTEDNELIEHIARALCREDGVDPDKIRYTAATQSVMWADGREWDNSRPIGPAWEQWERFARAALTAYRNHEVEL